MEEKKEVRLTIGWSADGKPAYTWMQEWMDNWDRTRKELKGALTDEEARRRMVWKKEIQAKLRAEFRARQKEQQEQRGKFQYEHPDRIRELRGGVTVYGGEHQRAGGQGTGNPENEPDEPR